MNLEHAVHTITEARIHRAPGALSGPRRPPLRRLRHAPVLDLRGHRLWPEDAEVFRQARAARIRLDLRLRAQPRTRLSRASSSDLRGDRRARQPASPTARGASRARASDAARRDSGEPREHLDVLISREGGLPLKPLEFPSTTPRTWSSGRAISTGFATSRIASRSASIRPVTSSSFTSTPTRCATSSATSSSVTHRCSNGSLPGRSESWFRRTWRARCRTCRRPRGGSSRRR